MNTFEDRAKALAHAAELVEKANEKNRNFESIAELLKCNHPQDIADDLLEVYFEFVYLMSEVDNYECKFIGDPLYMLKDVYLAFAKVQTSDEPTVVLKVKDTSKAI